MKMLYMNLEVEAFISIQPQHYSIPLLLLHPQRPHPLVRLGEEQVVLEGC